MRISKALLAATMALFFVFAPGVAFANSSHEIMWLSVTEPMNLSPGETAEWTATFMVSEPLEDVIAFATMGLHSAIEAPAVYLNELQPNQIYTIRYTIHVPMNAKKATYSGTILVIAETQVRPGVRNLVDVLPMKIRVK